MWWKFSPSPKARILHNGEALALLSIQGLYACCVLIKHSAPRSPQGYFLLHVWVWVQMVTPLKGFPWPFSGSISLVQNICLFIFLFSVFPYSVINSRWAGFGLFWHRRIPCTWISARLVVGTQWRGWGEKEREYERMGMETLGINPKHRLVVSNTKAYLWKIKYLWFVRVFYI